MRRREVIALIGGAAAWPLGAYAQETTLPLIGFLSSRSPEDSKPHTEGFLRGLRSFGYIDGRTAKAEARRHCLRRRCPFGACGENSDTVDPGSLCDPATSLCASLATAKSNSASVVASTTCNRRPLVSAAPSAPLIRNAGSMPFELLRKPMALPAGTSCSSN